MRGDEDKLARVQLVQGGKGTSLSALEGIHMGQSTHTNPFIMPQIIFPIQSTIIRTNKSKNIYFSPLFLFKKKESSDRINLTWVKLYILGMFFCG